MQSHEKLRAIRTETRTPQRVIAEAIGVPRSAVAKIESGAQPLHADHIPAAAVALGVPAGDLVEHVSEYLARTAAAGVAGE